MYSYIEVIESQMWDVFETQCSEVSLLHETGKSLCTVSGTFMWRSARTEVGGRNVRTWAMWACRHHFLLQCYAKRPDALFRVKIICVAAE